MGFVKGFFRLLIGVVFGIASVFALVPAFAAFNKSGSEDNGAGYIWLVVAFVALLCVFAPTIRRAFGRGFLALGACVFALPLSMILLSGRVSQDMVSAAAPGQEGAAAVGSGIAGIAMTGAAGFIGFFLGGILLLVGLILSLGGRREVIVLDRRPS